MRDDPRVHFAIDIASAGLKFWQNKMMHDAAQAHERKERKREAKWRQRRQDNEDRWRMRMEALDELLEGRKRETLVDTPYARFGGRDL